MQWPIGSLITPAEIASKFGICRKTVREKVLAPNGTLPVVRVSPGRVLIRSEDLEQWLDRQTEMPHEPAPKA